MATPDHVQEVGVCFAVVNYFVHFKAFILKQHYSRAVIITLQLSGIFQSRSCLVRLWFARFVHFIFYKFVEQKTFFIFQAIRFELLKISLS